MGIGEPRCTRCRCCGGCLNHGCVCDRDMPSFRQLPKGCAFYGPQNVSPTCNPFPHQCELGKHKGEHRPKDRLRDSVE